MDAYQILVIVLSILLALFLVLSIVVVVLIIKLVKKINLVTDKAMHAVENVEEMADTIKNVAGTSIIGGIGAKLWQRFNKAQSKK
jgi:1,4-dihydroxy-2-naphthoate octaprenyltransferase